jgi:hypothetical protein
MMMTEKYNKIEVEYETFKNKLVKEFKLLKTDHERVSHEKGVLKEALFEFRRYFMNFHIDDDGNIKYVEN